MGGQQTKTTNQQERLKINHPKFANAKQVQISKQEFGIEISVLIANQKQVLAWEQQMKSAPSNSESLFLPKSYKFTKQGFCGSSGYVNIVYDNFPFLLQDQVLNRESLQHKKFQQNQLWYLAYTLISCASTIHSKGQKVGDIRPQNIFINQEGQVKIATLYSWPSQQSNYSKTFYDKQVTYLSPQQLKDLQFGKMEASVDFRSSQAFSIGLTILDAAILQNSSKLYGQNLRFDFDLLNKKLSTLFEQQYSELFKMLLSNLCSSDVSNRCTCAQLFEWLKPQQESIINLQDFEVQGVPDKLLKTKRVGNSSPLRPYRLEQFHQYSANKETPYSGNQGFSIQPVPDNNFGKNYTNTSTAYKYESSYQPSYQTDTKNNYNYPSNIKTNPGSSDYYGGNSVTKTTTVNIEKTNANMYGGSYPNYQNPSNNGDYKSSSGNNEFKSYLDKIDEQLRQSRRNFPSS